MAAKARQRLNTFPFTVQGIWQPEDPESVRAEMRAFSACVRWAFCRLIVPEARDKPEETRLYLKREGQRLFGLNSRYVDDAIAQAKEIIESQAALLPMELADMQARYERVERQERKLTRALKPATSDEEAALLTRLQAVGRKKERLGRR